MSNFGKLSAVATPIGNLEDITLRAIRTLKECDAILCEDTRVTAKLLARYEISKPLIRCDEKAEEKAAKQAIEMLEEGKSLALVSDAGTPGISDPGSRLVARVRRFLPDAKIEAIPGASALTATLSIAGLDSGEFTFLGFLPHKKGRQTALKRILASDIPVVLYESPHRIQKLLEEIGDGTVTIGRELTKIHEEVRVGPALEVAHALKKEGKDRGEFVVIVHPK
ncbi:MAG TPA: 16S rRNA (cytidine(1402)-2'-O)-methyltransferase [Pyrinomonadaceae bacterium]|jgi:16S rRNA (cytidine1402-2'-O)-methyltransferase|nr:16S rRNA (cytidine(1402)-2'-O)-methyltransferase [Pyrinomonadaceae bacterium]